MIRSWFGLLFSARSDHDWRNSQSWRFIVSFAIMAMMVPVGVLGEEADLKDAARELLIGDRLERPSLRGKTRAFQIGSGTDLILVPVKRGSFIMGREEQLHEVTISQDFWIGRYEITREQYEKIMGVTKNGQLNEKTAKLPQNNVSWDEAKEFCRELTIKCKDQLSSLGGYYFDLPTEAQWEYAAGGGQYDDRKKFSGSDDSDEVAWHALNSNKKSQAIGSNKLKPNGYGIYDMLGNVAEWCLDVFHDKYPAESVDPVGTKGLTNFLNTKYVVRGGSCNSSPDRCSIVERDYYASDRYGMIGFRVVLVKDKDAEKKKESARQNTEIMSHVGEGDWKNAWESTVRRNKLLQKLPGGNEENGDMVVMLSEKVELKLKRIPAGEFTNTRIKKTFEIKHTYWIGETEVTQAQYLAVMGVNPAYFHENEKCPVENVSWNDAMSFCRKLTELERSSGHLPTGYEYSLPTEAQWEFAARSNEPQNCKYSGGNFLKDYGWYYENSGKKELQDADWDSAIDEKTKSSMIIQKMTENGNSTHQVAKLNMNKFGLYDMSGNVWELCRDVFDSHWDYDPETLEGMKDGVDRVKRGGSWGCNAKDCRLSQRSSVDSPDSRDNDIGFRVALVPIQ